MMRQNSTGRWTMTMATRKICLRTSEPFLSCVLSGAMQNYHRSASCSYWPLRSQCTPAMLFRLQAVLVDVAEPGPSGVGPQAHRRGRKKQLQPQGTRKATAQALAPAAGPSSGAVRGKRALRSPATAATKRRAKKQKQDGGKLEKRISVGEEAAITLTMMSGRSGQAARETATSNDIDSGPKPAAPSPSKARKTKSLQALSGPTAAMGAEMQSLGGQQTSRPRGKPRRHPLPVSKQTGAAVASEKKQKNTTSNHGSEADETFIPLEGSAEVEDEAAETDEKVEPAHQQGDNVAADRDDWGAGDKAAAPPGSPATQGKQQAKEKVRQTAALSKLMSTPHA